MPATTLLTRPLSRRAFTIGSALSMTAFGAVGSISRWSAVAASDLPALTVVAKDYAYDLPESTAAGFTAITLDNQGADFHHAMFVKLNEGVTFEQFTAAKSEAEMFAMGASLGGPMVGPMSQSTVVINLEEGNYAIMCVIPGPDGMPHFTMGMISPFAVTANAEAGAAPEASMTIELTEMMFHGLPATVPAGPATWEVTNTGKQMHEFIIFQLAEGATIDQVLAFVGEATGGATPEASPVAAATPVMTGPPPFSLPGAVAPMSPGHTAYWSHDFQPANYLAICFVIDPASGMPHAALGMLMPFTVA